MKLTYLLGKRYKEHPSNVSDSAYAFLLRGGYVRECVDGSHVWLPPTQKIFANLHEQVRKLFTRLNGQEVILPANGSYSPRTSCGKELAPSSKAVTSTTDSQVIIFEQVKDLIDSYKQLPSFIHYLEGVPIPDNEYPKELLAPHISMQVTGIVILEHLDAYTEWEQRFRSELETLLHFIGIKALSTLMKQSRHTPGIINRAFLMPSQLGSDIVVHCSACNYQAHQSMAQTQHVEKRSPLLPLEKVHTPGMKTIEAVAQFLGVKPEQTAKALFYQTDNEGKLVLAIIRGDLEADEDKVAQLIHVTPQMATEESIHAVGAVPGYASPLGIASDNCHVLIDNSIFRVDNLVCGANEPDYHLKNFTVTRDLPGISGCDFAKVQAGDLCPNCGAELTTRHYLQIAGSELLTAAMVTSSGIAFLNRQGKATQPALGRCRIALEQVIRALIETSSDQYGPRWHVSVSPWKVHICALKYNAPEVKRISEWIYQTLQTKGIETLFDNRDERPGVQFADADLLGVPVRLIISERNCQNNMVELKIRGSNQSELVQVEAVLDRVAALIKNMLENE